MILYTLDRNNLCDQPDIEEMSKMDDETLETKVKKAQECNDYMADSWQRKNLWNMISGDLLSGENAGGAEDN